MNARFLACLSPIECQIAQLALQNDSSADIAAETGCNIRKVQRFLKNLHESMNDTGE